MPAETTVQKSVDVILTTLQKELDGLDPVGTRNAALEAADIVERQAASISARITTIRNSHLAIAGLSPKIAAEKAWCDFLTAARRTLIEELDALPSKIYDSRTLGLKENLELSVQAIDSGISDRYRLNTLRLGELLQGAGYQAGRPQPGQTFGEVPWFGSLPEVKRRLVVLQQEHEDNQHRLDDARLSDVERRQVIAEIIERNARPQRKTRGDGSVYEKYPDGRVVEIENPL